MFRRAHALANPRPDIPHLLDVLERFGPDQVERFLASEFDQARISMIVPDRYDRRPYNSWRCSSRSGPSAALLWFKAEFGDDLGDPVRLLCERLRLSSGG